MSEILPNVFRILSLLISIYSTLCFLNIIFSWIPAVRYTKFGQLISSITDPYLNLFRRVRWLQVGNVNFSPILSVGLLSVLGSTLAQISKTGKLNVSNLLISLVYLLWQAGSWVFALVLILALIRLVVLIAKHGVTPYNSPWNHVDALLNPFCYRITRPFSVIFKRTFNYRTSLGITVAILALALAATYVLMLFIIHWCEQIPF